MSNQQSTGVYPLLCAVCLQVVGVINVADLHRMHADGEVYICASCLAHTSERAIEVSLQNLKPETWYQFTGVIARAPDHKWATTNAYTVNPVIYVEAPRA